MHLNRLILRNFRNYVQANVTFSPSVNVIFGDNGQGKTNLLEAIYLISTGRSFRTRRLTDLIRKGETFFYIEAHFIKDGIEQSLKIFYEENARKIQYNQTVYPNFTNLLGILPGVLLSPDDHALVSGTPPERRRFLDLHIAQMDPLYVHHLGRYFRAMKQRNHLLRSGDEATLSAWEEAMAHSGSYIMSKRREVITSLQDPISQWMQRLSLGKDSLKVDYDSSFPAGTDDAKLAVLMMTQWQKNRPKEMRLGSTLTGPHRDDLAIEISGKEAKNFSSEGQKRCLTASLRLAEWQRFQETVGSPPLMGIDDFGIQLDSERQILLQQQMQTLGQVFLTSPQPLPLTTYHTIHIEKGNVNLPQILSF